MSVTTTSDEKRQRAREILETVKSNIKEAQELLVESLHPDTWGSGEYNSTYTQTLENVELELVKLRIEVNRIKNEI
jgi:hypothetical protein